MLKYKKIKIGKNYIEAISIKLLSKSFVLLRGKRGYVMCGYLDLKAANKFNDVAVKITGVSTIKGALSVTVHSCTREARRIGIRKGQVIRDVLRIIA